VPCRASIAVLIPPAVRASHEASLAFYTQITANQVHIHQSYYYVPTARQIRTFPERSTFTEKKNFHTS
jgi:hypothetical protein